ncbi:40S ribosomal protein S4 [Mycena metata]|uniref:40S ribosomal protein S4 n=1 Tax=Mycena metata TaxID=1033252 RepID=A0AAD7HA83_9AGAR|nr:40S ribosomal protein S4 [Mycena metata]
MSTPALPGHGSFEWKKKRKQTHSGAVRHRPLPELTDDSFVVELNEEVDELHGSVVDVIGNRAGATAKAAARNTTRITPEEATYKLLNVRKVAIGAGGVPHIVTHDGRTIRYPDPAIQVNDTVKYDLNQAKLVDFVKFDTGNMCVITGGRNMGRAGVIVHREKHIGGFDIVHVKDSLERTFATRVTNIFVIGDGPKPWISLPKGKGTNLTISEERDLKRKRAAEH